MSAWNLASARTVVHYELVCIFIFLYASMFGFNLILALSNYAANKITRLFCWLVSKLDTNHNLATFPKLLEKVYSDYQREVYSIWIGMLYSSLHEHTFGWEKGKLEPNISYNAHFPFSFVFIPHLQHLKNEAQVLAQR